MAFVVGEGRGHLVESGRAVGRDHHESERERVYKEEEGKQE